MPRRARLMLPGVPVHVIQRGNNRHACFHADEDYRRYLEWLCEYAPQTGCRIHAYVLMTNHVHLLLTPAAAESTAHLMKSLGQRYVQYVNRVYQRSGTLWEGRFRSCLVDTDGYFLACQRYIELNPVRAAMVAHPASYRWSSYRANAQGRQPDSVVEPHPAYLALAGTGVAQLEAYRALFKNALETDVVDSIRAATNGNFALGSARFASEVATALGRRAVPGRSGRPRKASEPESLPLLR